MCREVKHFFPRLKRPLESEVRLGELEKTVVLIRPDAYKQFGQQILSALEGEHKFVVEMRKEVRMGEGQVAEFYKDKKKEIYYKSLVETMVKLVNPTIKTPLASHHSKFCRQSSIFSLDTNTFYLHQLIANSNKVLELICKIIACLGLLN